MLWKNATAHEVECRQCGHEPVVMREKPADELTAGHLVVGLVVAGVVVSFIAPGLISAIAGGGLMGAGGWLLRDALRS